MKKILIVLSVIMLCACGNKEVVVEEGPKTFNLGYEVKNLETEYNYSEIAYGNENEMVIVGKKSEGYKIIIPVGTKYFEENNILKSFTFYDLDSSTKINASSVKTNTVIDTSKPNTGKIEITAKTKGKEGTTSIDYEVKSYQKGKVKVKTDIFHYQLYGKYSYESNYLKVQVKMTPTDLATFTVFSNATATTYGQSDGRISLKYKSSDGYHTSTVDELAAENKSTNATRLFYTKKPKIKQTTYLYFQVNGKITDEAYLAFQHDGESTEYSFYKLK